jgi:hypothetical protein
MKKGCHGFSGYRRRGFAYDEISFRFREPFFGH